MSHASLRREAHQNHTDKMARMMRREAGGGVMPGDKRQDESLVKKALGEHDKQLHPGKHTKLAFAAGGGVDSAPQAARADRAGRARGGRAGHGKTHVNVIVAPQGGPPGPPPGLGGLPPGLPPHPPMLPPGPPPMPPSGPAGPPPGMGAPGGIAGGPPIGAMAPRVPMLPGGPGGGLPPGLGPRARGGAAFKRGGRARADGGAADDEEDEPRSMGSAMERMSRKGGAGTGEKSGPNPSDYVRARGGRAHRSLGGASTSNDYDAGGGDDGEDYSGGSDRIPRRTNKFEEKPGPGQPIPRQARGGRARRAEGGDVGIEDDMPRARYKPENAMADDFRPGPGPSGRVIDVEDMPAAGPSGQFERGPRMIHPYVGFDVDKAGPASKGSQPGGLKGAQPGGNPVKMPTRPSDYDAGVPHWRGDRASFGFKKGGRPKRASGGGVGGKELQHDFIGSNKMDDLKVGGAGDAAKGRSPEWTITDAHKGGKGNSLNKVVGPSERARGGGIDDGAGGGLGRLEKTAMYGKNADKGEGSL